MRALLFPPCLSLVCCFFASAVAASPQQTESVSSGSAPTQSDYFDNDDQRRLASIRFEADSEHPGAIRIGVRAIGADVDPIPGYRGVRGANRYTAEELELILSGQREFVVRTTYRDGHVVSSQGMRSGAAQTLPQRRLLPNGRIDFLARTTRRYPVELIAATTAYQPGIRTTEMLVDGEARFQVTYDIAAGVPLIADVRSLGNDHYGPPETLLLSRRVRFAAAAADEYPSEPPVEVPDWEQRDIEGKWFVFRNDVDAHPEHLPRWIGYLAGQRELDLLEWIAIYQPDAFKSHGVGNVLVKLQSPGWLRVGVWHVSAPMSFGHSGQLANSIVAYADPPVALDWLQVHRDEIDNWEAGLDSYLQDFKSQDIQPKDSSHLAPPLRAADVLKHLDAPPSVRDFANQTIAAPGVVYVHQVLRAIDGAVISGRYDKKTIGKIRALVGHSNSSIRQHALLAFTYLAPVMSRSERFADLVAIIDNPDATAAIRESALMGYSYHRHPQVVIRLHQIVEHPAHPAWMAAVSRLGDLGYSVSLPLLERVNREELTTEQAAVLARTIQRFQAMDERREESGQQATSREALQLTELAAWAKVTSDPRAEELTEAAIEIGRRLPDKQRMTYSKVLEVPSESGIWLPGDAADYDRAFENIRSAALAR